MKRLTLCCLLISQILFAGTKERNWKAGTVTADSSVTTAAYTSGAAGPQHIAEDTSILTIRGGDFIYTAQERHAWDGWCLLIQGEQIRYSQDNRKLDVIDADGGKCRLNILKQEKRSFP
jgi:hypothetical protein